MKRLFLILLAFSGGCATSPRDSEGAREIALQYLGGDFGTTGPFSRNNKKDLEVLAPADRNAASALLDQGAVGFVVFKAGAPTRIVLVGKGRVVGDYRAAP